MLVRNDHLSITLLAAQPDIDFSRVMSLPEHHCESWRSVAIAFDLPTFFDAFVLNDGESL